MAVSLAGESSARVISTRWAEPPWNCSSRTSEPTETASSTSAVSSWGVDTETSTPQLSLKSHWFLGWLTRATTAGDGELLLGQQRDHQVVLVVAGGRDDDVDRGQAGRVEGRDLAGVRRHPGDVERGAQALDQLGVLLEDEHVVAAGVQIATRWRCRRSPPRRWRLSRTVLGSRRHRGPASRRARATRRRAQRGAGRRPPGPPARGHRAAARRSGSPRRGSGRPGCSRSHSGRPAQASGSERSISVRRPVGSDQSATSSSGSRRRRTWSMVHVTVATVGMPRRW